MNKVQLIGRLGADPEVRSLPSGKKVTNLRMATSERWRDKDTGERQEKTEWHSISIFNEKLGEIAEKYLRKGSQAYIEGQLQTRKWTDRDGHDRYSTEIVLSGFNGSIELLDSKSSNTDDGERDRGGRSSGKGYDGRRSGGDRQRTFGGGGFGGGGGSFDDDLDDDVPFATALGREPGTSRRRI